MILTAIPTWVAALIGIVVWGLFLLMAFALAYAKRDVTIDITLLEYRV